MHLCNSRQRMALPAAGFLAFGWSLSCFALLSLAHLRQ